MTKRGELLFQNPDQRREAVLATARRTGFVPELVEKDWLLSLVLQYIVRRKWPVVFKGGTCLAKCYLGFYRLSEDLDFVHDNSGAGLGRSARRADFSGIEQMCEQMVLDLDFISIEDVRKFDEHHQMMVLLSYSSAVTGTMAELKIELTHRDELVMGPVAKKVHTLVTHPVLDEPLVGRFETMCMQLEEVAAEKIRACVTRPIPAIRDYFDVFVLERRLPDGMATQEFVQLVSTKLQGHRTTQLPKEWLSMLRRQIAVELKPTLAGDIAFELDASVHLVEKTLDRVATFRSEC